MNALLELADECERIVVPSHELDFAIARELCTTVLKRNRDDTANYATTNWRYTASLDAALSVVPTDEFGEPWLWSIHTGGHTTPEASVINADTSETFNGRGRTDALALCAAALRARAALVPA